MNLIGNCALCLKSRMHKQLGKDSLYCHAEPPKIVLLPGAEPGALQVVSLFPEMLGNHWCAMFEGAPTNDTKMRDGRSSKVVELS